MLTNKMMLPADECKINVNNVDEGADNAERVEGDEEDRTGVICARESKQRARENLQQLHLRTSLRSKKSNAAGPPAVARWARLAHARVRVAAGAHRGQPPVVARLRQRPQQSGEAGEACT